MSDAPERIWASEDAVPKGPGERTGSWVDHGPGNHDEFPYIRADKVQALVAEIERLRGIVKKVRHLPRQHRPSTLVTKLLDEALAPQGDET